MILRDRATPMSSVAVHEPPNAQPSSARLIRTAFDFGAQTASRFSRRLQLDTESAGSKPWGASGADSASLAW